MTKNDQKCQQNKKVKFDNKNIINAKIRDQLKAE